MSPPRRPHHARPLVYVAGPYTFPDCVLNTHRAIKWGERLQETELVTAFVPHSTLLWQAVCPHEDVEYWYDYDLAILARCDALFRFPGKSSGADREMTFARERGIPIFESEIKYVWTWAKHWLGVT